MISEYHCKSTALGFETRNFNQWHVAEVRNQTAIGFPINARTIPAEVTRAEALELVNKWNRIGTGDACFWIAA